MDSLKVTDAASEAVAVAPRVKLSDIEAAILARFHFTGKQAISAIGAQMVGMGAIRIPTKDQPSPLDVLSICILVMKNGFTVIGKSAPASPENFNADLGKQYAYEDAVRQLWPLMGFALRDKLANG